MDEFCEVSLSACHLRCPGLLHNVLLQLEKQEPAQTRGHKPFLPVGDLSVKLKLTLLVQVDVLFISGSSNATAFFFPQSLQNPFSLVLRIPSCSTLLFTLYLFNFSTRFASMSSLLLNIAEFASSFFNCASSLTYFLSGDRFLLVKCS